MKFGFPVSGKTGTTNKNRDFWPVCFTPDLAIAVWVRCDTGADTGLTGATGALPVSARFSSDALRTFRTARIHPSGRERNGTDRSGVRFSGNENLPSNLSGRLPGRNGTKGKSASTTW